MSPYVKTLRAMRVFWMYGAFREGIKWFDNSYTISEHVASRLWHCSEDKRRWM